MKKIIASVILLVVLFVPISFSNALSLGYIDSSTCNVWREGMPPKMIDGKSQTQYNYCTEDKAIYKRLYELETEVIKYQSLYSQLDSRISALEADNRNLKEQVIVKQDETKQLLIRLITLMISKK